jgi:hypothetical protein
MLTELITPADPAAAADSAALAPVFDALLGELTQLSRNHLLYFRVQVGRSVADALSSAAPAAWFAAPRWLSPGAGGQPAVLT